ncbi:MAG: rhamnogalacturonan acetylesterase [Acidobacteria bacterium]|nr:rhamnogalacturonan acetylesterase [Acidobacteriota bacterium]MCW5948341.1 rhamnogalacturonan acetylesterase [Pyrinomonadaceae bacterium]
MRAGFAFALLIASTFVAAGQRPVVTIFLAGDSTCAEKLPEKRPETGWGEMLGKYFKDGSVRIENRAMNGRSTKTFIAEGRWQKILDDMRPGDWVFVQFGHNDESKEKGERYTPPDAFRGNLARFVTDVRERKGNIVLLTPVMRRKFDKDGKFVDQHPKEYPEAFRSVAAEYKVPLIDMHRKSEALLVRLGPEASRQLFLQLKPGENPNYPNGIEDNTHFDPAGAEQMASLVADGIRESRIALRRLLKKR